MKNKIWTWFIIIAFVSSVLTLLIRTLFNDKPVVEIVALTGAIVLDTVGLILLAIVGVTTIKSKKTQKSQCEKIFEQAEFFVKTDEERKFADVWKDIIVERNGNDLICKNGGGGFSFYLGDSLISFDCNVVSRMKTNLNQPQSRRFRPFRQILTRRIDIRLRSPLPKIIKNGGFEVASEFNGKKTIKTRQSSEVVLVVLRARITQYLAEFLPLNLVQVCFHSATKRVEGLGGYLAADKIKPQKIALPKMVAEGVMYIKTSENLSPGSGRRISFADNVICDAENGRIVFGDYNDDEITYKVLGNVFVQLTADGALKAILTCDLNATKFDGSPNYME